MTGEAMTTEQRPTQADDWWIANTWLQKAKECGCPACQMIIAQWLGPTTPEPTDDIYPHERLPEYGGKRGAGPSIDLDALERWKLESAANPSSWYNARILALIAHVERIDQRLRAAESERDQWRRTAEQRKESNAYNYEMRVQLEQRIAELTHMIGAADTGLAERLSASEYRIAELEAKEVNQ